MKHVTVQRKVGHEKTPALAGIRPFGSMFASDFYELSLRTPIS